MLKLSYKKRNRGFTLIELLVTIGIIGVLAGIGVVTVGKIKGTKNQTTCVSNLRGISQGLQSYYNDYMSFPEDGYPDDGNDIYPLSTDLAGYINDKSTFVCPEDKDITSTGDFASYDPYYVARKGSYGENELAIGCPRHRGAKNSTSTFASGSTKIMKVGAVLVNEQEIPPDGTTAQRTINSVNDTMTFKDLSTVTVTNASGGSYACFLVQSVRLSDGTLYSIVRVQDDGAISVEVSSGSKFEIVTPSAIVGVRGTKFTVTTTDLGFTTEVSLTEGTVVLMNRDTGKATTLTGVDEGTVDVPMHSHYHTHANGERHMHDHQSKNQSHHGKPLAGTDDDENVADPDDITICHKPRTFAKKTMVIDASALSGHVGHGDTEGACSSDDDKDGYTVAQGDCDDNDANVNPGEAEIAYNDIDDDCNPATLDDDIDGDTYLAAEDCDDNDASVNPGAAEIPDNGIDDDCNASTLDITTDQAHVDYINDLGKTSSEVKDYLLANSPLSLTVLIAAVDRSIPMNTSDLKDVLLKETSLAESVLIAAINREEPMNSSDLNVVLLDETTLTDNVLLAVINKNPLLENWGNYDIFIQYSNLSETVLDAMINREGELLMSIDFKDVLINNSLLPQSIVDQMTAGKPTSMNSSHRNQVLNAQNEDE